MPDWSNPLEIAKDVEIFQKLAMVMLGLSTWEIIIQLPFDWSIVSRKRKARWPVFFYFYCKYSIWATVIGVVIATNVTTKINCQVVYTFCHFLVNTSTGCASLLLMLRTIAVWNRRPFVMVPLVVISMGHWAFLLHGSRDIRSRWSDEAKACVIDVVFPAFVEAKYVYTMVFDFIVLVLTTIGLVMSPARSSLWQLLFRQGIIYFVVACLANLVPTIFRLLNLNSIMNLMFALPAAIASSFVVCRSFISLANHLSKDVWVSHATRVGISEVTGGSDGILTHFSGGVNLDNIAEDKRSRGSRVAGIVFRSISEGIDSMGEAYGIDGVDKTRTTTTLATGHSKRRHEHGDANEDSQVVVHMMDLERPESMLGKRTVTNSL